MPTVAMPRSGSAIWFAAKVFPLFALDAYSDFGAETSMPGWMKEVAGGEHAMCIHEGSDAVASAMGSLDSKSLP
jgi:hypothetical protein